MYNGRVHSIRNYCFKLNYFMYSNGSNLIKCFCRSFANLTRHTQFILHTYLFYLSVNRPIAFKKRYMLPISWQITLRLGRIDEIFFVLIASSTSCVLLFDVRHCWMICKIVKASFGSKVCEKMLCAKTFKIIWYLFRFSIIFVTWSSFWVQSVCDGISYPCDGRNSSHTQGQCGWIL